MLISVFILTNEGTALCWTGNVRKEFGFHKVCTDIVFCIVFLLIIHVEAPRFLLPFPILFCEKFRGISCYNYKGVLREAPLCEGLYHVFFSV
jgi:hypothetical protein